MNPAQIFLPSVAQVFLTYGVLVAMFRKRVGEMKKHRAGMQSIADPVREAQIFAEAANVSDNFENLFEMPVLFFVASLVIFVLSKVDGIYLALTWGYVICRIVHSVVHSTSNIVKYRFYSFFLSAGLLLAIWIRIAFQILTG
jgi:hypothetical protein